MKGIIRKKEISIILFLVAISASILPIGSATLQTNQSPPMNILSSLNTPSRNTCTVTIYLLENKQYTTNSMILSTEDAYQLYEVFTNVNDAQTNAPFSDVHQQQQKQLRQQLDHVGLVSTNAYTIYDRMVSLQFFLKGLFTASLRAPLLLKSNMTAFICSIGSQGIGLVFPPILLPRPRLMNLWAGFSDASTSVISFLPFGGFMARGKQTGVAVGFIGIGASFAFPSAPLYVLIGYAAMIRISAESIETFP